MRRLLISICVFALACPALAQVTTAPAYQTPYSDAQAYAQAQAAIASSLSGPLAMVSGSTVGGAGVVTTPGVTAGAPATGLTYLHRYANVSLTVPAVAVGGTGTATASVPGTAVGDQCFVAPTSTTSALTYIMAAGWVTTAGTVKVALAAPSLVAISAATVNVNMLCAQ